MSLQADERLGSYEILALVGAGGMGEVYKARDPKLDRDVAIKVLPAMFADDPERLSRFEREAKVLASLNHPNIASIYGLEERALVMEFVEGKSPKGPMAFADAWKICSQIAAGLEYAHEKRVMHRDLKPANVKVTPEGRMKILDFGLAKAFTGESARPASSGADSPTLTLGATQAGVILGTAAYMAPEQVRGKEADRQADIWAFGVVLYELLTGEQLFKGVDASETMARVLTDRPGLERAPTNIRRLAVRVFEERSRRAIATYFDCHRHPGLPLCPPNAARAAAVDAVQRRSGTGCRRRDLHHGRHFAEWETARLRGARRRRKRTASDPPPGTSQLCPPRWYRRCNRSVLLAHSQWIGFSPIGV
jgi:serine/threonine protein kinase